MPKLVFEDDDGRRHEIKIESISSELIKDSDVIVATYEIGSLNQEDSNRILQELNYIIKGFFPNNRVLTLASRNGVEDVKLNIIREEKTDEL